MANIVELKKVDKVYRGTIDTQVLFGISLSFEQGSFNSIVGESGSGKSTLLNIIGTLDRPTSGELWLEGRSTSSLNADRMAELRNRSIGFVFQFHYLLPEFSAMDNVLMPWLISNRRADAGVKKRAEELFDLMGIAKVKNNMANKMSGGQQQRTAIARALIHHPSLILADEPTGNLDPSTAAVVMDALVAQTRLHGASLVLVTHSVAATERADRVLRLNRDGLVGEGAEAPAIKPPRGAVPNQP